MPRDLAQATASLLPSWPERVGMAGAAVLTYLGGVALLGVTAIRALARTRPRELPGLLFAMVRQADWLFTTALPLVALVHVGIGSFLAMQAFYGATFVEGVGPVVGVGLFRNVAPLLSGMTVAGILAARLTPAFSQRPLVDLDADPSYVPDRQVVIGLEPDPRPPAEAPRMVGVRLVVATIAGPILAFWGGSVGTVVGWLVSHKVLGVSSSVFFRKFVEMLWARDVTGLFVKGASFGFIAALLACYEGLRGPKDVSAAATRAVCLAAIMILLLNSTWYVLLYMAGPAFGPTVLPPPTR